MFPCIPLSPLRSSAQQNPPYVTTVSNHHRVIYSVAVKVKLLNSIFNGLRFTIFDRGVLQ